MVNKELNTTELMLSLQYNTRYLIKGCSRKVWGEEERKVFEGGGGGEGDEF